MGLYSPPFLPPPGADKLGRKPSILASSAVFTLGGTLQVIGSDLAMLYAGRLIAGLGNISSFFMILKSGTTQKTPYFYVYAK